MVRGEITLQEVLKMRKDSSISKGTHYRILAQARRNVRKSVLTTAIAVQLGIIRSEELQKLVTLVSRAPTEADPSTMEEVSALVVALVNRIVML